MQNTITPQKVADHGKFLISVNVNAAHGFARQYRAGELTWLETTNLIHKLTLGIFQIVSVLGPLLEPFNLSPDQYMLLNEASTAAATELDALQKELREYMSANIETIA